MKRYVVKYELDEAGWWVATVPSVPGAMTQGRSIEQARNRIREALSLLVKGASKATLVDQVHLPNDLKQVVQAVAKSRERMIRAESEAEDSVLRAARVLTEAQLSQRDVGQLLDLSHQRVHQILASSKPKPARTARSSKRRQPSVESSEKSPSVKRASNRGPKPAAASRD